MNEQVQDLKLVQRVRRRAVAWSQAPDPLDGAFAFDNMGAAEFEHGALPTSLAAMRAVGLPEPVRVQVGVYEAWYVGPPERCSVAEAFFRAELEDEVRPYRLEEGTGLRATYRPFDECDRAYPCDAWWAVDKDQHWVLCRTEIVAQAWRGAVHARTPWEARTTRSSP